FGVEYPFAAFDQVFVPELTALSLDHPGCVLLREQYLFGPTGTDSERETRAVVIAHGMSLMWMAGLVSHAWWDDLWLGQALADFLAALGTAAGRDLGDWAEKWLNTSDVNTLTAELTVADGAVTAAALEQTASAAHPVLRPHTVDLCLYRADGTRDVLRVEVTG